LDPGKGDGGRAITSFAIVTTDAAPRLSRFRFDVRELIGLAPH
jgi:hypothetical protein